MCIPTKSKMKPCVICKDFQISHLECKICIDTHVCFDCSVKLCENGICNMCPICRQENWKRIKTPRVKICIKKSTYHTHLTPANNTPANNTPTNNTPANNTPTTDDDNNNPSVIQKCCSILDKIWLVTCKMREICSILLIFIGYSFLFGIVTLASLLNNDQIQNLKKGCLFLVLSLVIGIIEVLFLYVCCKHVCCNCSDDY